MGGKMRLGFVWRGKVDWSFGAKASIGEDSRLGFENT